jgi:hypothetical protein
MAGGKALLQSGFTLATDVAMGGVEVVKTPLQEGVHHLGGLGDINLVADHGQTHAAEAKILFDLRKTGSHSSFLLVSYSITSYLIFAEM